MNIKLYLQIVILAMIVSSTHAGIMMSRSKKFEFLCDSSELIKKPEPTQEIVFAEIDSKMHPASDSFPLINKPELSEFDRLGPVGFGKKYGFAHYLVIRLGMQNNLPQLVIDKIVEHAKHIPEEKKSIKYFKCYDKFESLSLLPCLYAVLNSDACFRSKFAHFFNTYSVPGVKKQQETRWDFGMNFNNEDRFPYEEWLALGCMQKLELSVATLDDLEDDIAFLNEDNAIIKNSEKFGSSCCDSLQERAVDAEKGIVKVFDGQNLSLKRTFKHENGLPFMRIIYNPDGTELATQDIDGTITFWDLETRKCTHTITASPALACFYHNQGKEFVYSPDGIHWRVIKWSLFKKFERNDYPIETCNLLETLLDKKIEAVNDETESKDLDEEIELLVITNENDNINCSYDDYMKLCADFHASDASSTESESES